MQLRDTTSKRYGGKGVQQAVKNVIDKIGPKIIGMDVGDQSGIDYTMIELDGTDNRQI